MLIFQHFKLGNLCFLLLNSCGSALGVLYYCIIGVSAWVQVFLCLYYRISVENKQHGHSWHLTSYLVYGTEGVVGVYAGRQGYPKPVYSSRGQWARHLYEGPLFDYPLVYCSVKIPVTRCLLSNLIPTLCRQAGALTTYIWFLNNLATPH